jgi:hypothetical protein
MRRATRVTDRMNIRIHAFRLCSFATMLCLYGRAPPLLVRMRAHFLSAVIVEQLFR